MTDEIEVRYTSQMWPDTDLDLRAEGRTFEGYAAVFNSDSVPLPFVERIAPGAFKRTLGHDRDIRAFMNHDTQYLLGTRRAGTLGLEEDERGLRAKIDLPETTYANDLSTLIKRKDVNGMSFGFTVVRDEWSDGGDKRLWEPEPGTEQMTQRLVKEVRLYEVSVVTGWPAYPATSASVRHLVDAIGLDDSQPLLDAFDVLLHEGPFLTPDQRELLLRAINARTEDALVGPRLASWQERFASLHR